MIRLTNILNEIALRYKRIRCGLDIGFNDENVSSVLHEFRGGVWMTLDERSDFPFANEQFEVVVMNGSMASRDVVREVNRVLIPDGCLFFTVNERMRGEDGYTIPEIYKMIREGFDILSVRRPKWWFLRRSGRTLTVCARKKAWREHKGFIRDASLPFTPFRSRT